MPPHFAYYYNISLVYFFTSYIFFTMNTIFFSFMITTLAGFSTLLGILPCFIKNKSKETIISFSLAFSAGVMLIISFVSLIPEAISLLSKLFKGFPMIILLAIFVVCGIIFSMLIDQKLDKAISNNQLYKLGLISVFVLILHNIPEGITTFVSSSIDKKLGLVLAISIALHNIPEGISIAVPIYYSTLKLSWAFCYTLISGFSELLGAILAYLFLAKYINDFILAIILSVTAGIMIHISIYELIPEAFSYKKSKATILALLLGILIMLMCVFLL